MLMKKIAVRCRNIVSHLNLVVDICQLTTVRSLVSLHCYDTERLFVTNYCASNVSLIITRPYVYMKTLKLVPSPHGEGVTKPITKLVRPTIVGSMAN